MRMAPIATVVVALAALGAAPTAPGTTPTTQADMIRQAESAAPAAISKAATVLDWEMNVIREGTNGWTCMPDRADTPGPDPMCFDETAMAWAGAWMSGETPMLSGMGLSYMLAGGVDASNDDPFATEPPEGHDWIISGPHVMIFPTDPKSLDSMTSDMSTGGPWVMFKGTPYAHVMMPVK